MSADHYRPFPRRQQGGAQRGSAHAIRVDRGDAKTGNSAQRASAAATIRVHGRPYGRITRVSFDNAVAAEKRRKAANATPPCRSMRPTMPGAKYPASLGPVNRRQGVTGRRLDAREILRGKFPVEQFVDDRGDVIRALILVVKIIGMLPDVDR